MPADCNCDRYNEDTGAGIEARYPLGCPYFWGGRDTEKILEPAHPEQESDYYKTENQYLYGLDCAGFTRWVVEQAGYTPHDSISNLLNKGLDPDFVRLRTFVAKPGTPMGEKVEAGDFVPCTDEEKVAEIRRMLEQVEGCSGMLVSDHIVNLLEDVRGSLKTQKEEMIRKIRDFEEIEGRGHNMHQLGHTAMDVFVRGVLSEEGLKLYN